MSRGRLPAAGLWKMPHSPELRGKGCHHSAKASGGEDLQIKEPVRCRDASAFHFHATLAGMYGPTLIRDKVIQVGEPCEKRLVAPCGVMVTVDGQITLSTSAPKPCVPLLWHTAPQ